MLLRRSIATKQIIIRTTLFVGILGMATACGNRKDNNTSAVTPQQAEALAERLKSDVPGDNAARVNRLYLLTVSRPAKPEEVAAALAFVDSCMNELKSDEQVAWTQLCHAVLGSNSFLFCE